MKDKDRKIKEIMKEAEEAERRLERDRRDAARERMRDAIDYWTSLWKKPFGRTPSIPLIKGDF